MKISEYKNSINPNKEINNQEKEYKIIYYKYDPAKTYHYKCPYCVIGRILIYPYKNPFTAYCNRCNNIVLIKKNGKILISSKLLY